jgi:hypothetical protein
MSPPSTPDASLLHRLRRRTIDWTHGVDDGGDDSGDSYAHSTFAPFSGMDVWVSSAS